MSRIRTLSVAALVMALAVAASSARAADEPKKSDSGAVHGVVKSIAKDAFTVTLHAKKGETASPEEKTFTVTEGTEGTVFFKVSHKKAEAGEKATEESTPAKFADLKDGDVVAVVADSKGKTAKSVKFHTPAKKKPA
ncbi:MAG TPA: hypothetical protein DDY78_22780 [Planctomycetales bacterium]|nr:hypothetical protein [Planctomycetales bacterium]